MINNKIFPFALFALSHIVFAAELPSAGSQLQQIPPAPVPHIAPPRVELRDSGAPAVAESGSEKIVVSSLQVTGEKAYSEAVLLAVTGFKPGSELTLSDLRAMAAKIADYYHTNGYFVAQAYLPAQDIKNGVVAIAVIEGQYGQIKLRNETTISDAQLNNRLGGLNSGDPVVSAPLESRLLLLSDLPGVKVKSTLTPGASPGASDLLVDVTPGPSVSGEVDADNAGNRYTGENRAGATINLNNPTGHGDLASLRAVTSGPGLHYVRASYQIPFDKVTVGVAYSYLEYALGREFEALHAHGTAKVASVFGSYPLIRSRNNNLTIQVAYDDRTFQDKIDIIPSVTDKKAHVLMESLYGDSHDTIGGGGQNAYFLTLSEGKLDIQTPDALFADSLTAHTNGQYNKASFSLMRLQHVTDAVSLYASVIGQIASKNLDVSEKMELGGMYGVRAYPEGEAYADQGYIMTLEARLNLPKFSERQVGQMQLIGFVDTGYVTVNKNQWVDGSNSRRLSGAGVGFNWWDVNNFSIKAYYAHKLGSEMATSAPDSSGRFWIQVVKYF
ncbi:MAG: Polypeptide-transport-associated domain protein ShlB-type [Herbaspirillum sp.]|nr:Polypeptide-transport-associated domain protein ShlB-type [Herbaspirillum sp.]